MKTQDHPCILTIAGSDSGGGAGIQADLKTITVLGGYGASVITALTAQNTRGVDGIHAPDSDFVRLQLTSVLSDLTVRAAKTGMLFSSEIIGALAPELAQKTFPLVVDPVCVSQSGHALLREDAMQSLVEKIIPLADIVTPNKPEAELLTGMTIDSFDRIKEAVARLMDMGAGAVLLKGGHMQGAEMTDYLGLPGRDIISMVKDRVDTANTHGTGCTLSAAIATSLGYGLDMEEAVLRAREYIHLSLVGAYNRGHGQGPVNHLAHLARQCSAGQVLEELREFSSLLEQHEKAGTLLPEEGLVTAMVLPFAASTEHVAVHRNRDCPRFNVDSAVSRLLLAVAENEQSQRMAFCINENDRVLAALRKSGFQIGNGNTDVVTAAKKGGGQSMYLLARDREDMESKVAKICENLA